eukprot:3699162-Prorocentrum_lima.AAC.1
MSQVADHVDRHLLLMQVRGRGGRYRAVCSGSDMYLGALPRQVRPETTKKGTCAVARQDGITLCHGGTQD